MTDNSKTRVVVGMSGGAASLIPCVHISFVVVADIDQFVPALRRAGQALHAGIRGRSVAREGNYVHISALLFIVHLDARQHGCHIVKQREEYWNL